MAPFTVGCCLVVVIATILGVNAVSGSTSGQLEFLENILSVADVIEKKPKLKAEYELRIQKFRYQQQQKTQFSCDVSFGRSATRPISVHKVRPGDIDVIAAFGDSISAGNGVGAQTLPGVSVQNRGEVWSIGGDKSLNEGVITLANIIRQFNPNLKGFSIGSGSRDNVRKSALNVAQPGGVNSDMPEQADLLVERLRSGAQYNLAEDWKLVTLFVGGNDFCAVCRRSGHSPDDYYRNFETAIKTLYDNLQRTIVNLVPMFDITPLEDFSTGPVCDSLQWSACSCVRNPATKPTLKPIQLEYFDKLESLANDARFKRDDFTVLLQPHMRDTLPPKDPNTGKYVDFLSPDCFHPNRAAHQAFAGWTWNTMLTPVGQKPYSIVADSLDVTLDCPAQDKPYIFTDGNSV